MVQVRHGLMLIGEASSGKSQIIKTLNAAMNAIDGQENFVKLITQTINPKSVLIGQMYGIFDADSKQWTDGILPLIMRNFSAMDDTRLKWVIFDGPVDAVWIESMNTVLDDNKKLCLTSGEIIRLTNQMAMIFETEDLQHASPATVSRCGMVFLESKNIPWSVMIHTFIQ